MVVGIIIVSIFGLAVLGVLAYAIVSWIALCRNEKYLDEIEEAREKKYKETAKQLFPEMYAQENSHKNNRKKPECKDVNILKSKIVTKTKDKEKEKTLEM